ncbi:MAG TPA: class I SAM-dependent methyltransferase [Candidatus Polarisedimenticolia bacterium]|nr:class I SAM-dependent methyltransferase [Candidatus Polarisedimenticolia bacterium]
MSPFADHFTSQAEQYARWRPLYPPSLGRHLASLAPSLDLAWDCGTGSGQAARMLAESFREVAATDPSAGQLGQASPHPRIRYRQGRESESGLPPRSAGLVCAAQAAHWFDLPAFYAEAERVLVPGGVLAIWCYGRTGIDPEVDRAVAWLHDDRLAAHWPSERAHVLDGYARLFFPYETLPLPPFAIESPISREALLGYLGSWSAVARCRRCEGVDPLAEVLPALERAWPDPESVKVVRWPIAVLAARAGLQRAKS